MPFPNGFGAIVFVIATPLPSRDVASGHSFISLSSQMKPRNARLFDYRFAATRLRHQTNPVLAASLSYALLRHSSRVALCRVALGRITPGHANTRHKRMSLPCPMRRRIRTQPTHRHSHPRASHATGNSPFQVERPRRSSHSAPIAGSIHLTQPPPSQRSFPRRHPPTHRRLES